ncbi:hypothetical protein GCM10009760_52900 [Kitasatospora kazusensis]|uniref:Uncharacterized protein n=1 Tax=Kitasatospora kazusensis TaxID=407974 RepID=A0ABP5LUI1_9ACTN
MDGAGPVRDKAGLPGGVPIPHPREAAAPPPAESGVDFCGDALLLLTGPFFPGSVSLADSSGFAVPADGGLDPEGRLTLVHRSLDQFLRGSLTFGNPPVDLLTHFAGSEEFDARLTAIVRETTALPVELHVTGILFPDGYGSVAAHMRVVEGWTVRRREQLIDDFGPKGRDGLTARIRDELLPALTAMSDRCRQGPPCPTVLPYFNLRGRHHPSGTRPGDPLRCAAVPDLPPLRRADPLRINVAPGVLLPRIRLLPAGLPRRPQRHARPT